MSLKSRSDGLDQKLILMPQQKTSFCALNTRLTYIHIYSSHPSIFAFLLMYLLVFKHIHIAKFNVKVEKRRKKQKGDITKINRKL
jgi:hypothetical protein